MMIIFKDKELECCSCKKNFTFTKGEQEFYLKKAFVAPRRCPECRKVHKKAIRQRRRDLVRTLRTDKPKDVKSDVKGTVKEKEDQKNYHKQQEVKKKTVKDAKK